MKPLKILFLFTLLLSSFAYADQSFYTPKENLKSLEAGNVDPDLPNVLLIGDSISIGYTPEVVDLLDGVANVRRPVNATRVNCGDTRKGLDQLSKWIGEEEWNVIHFNWGLHDLCYRHPDAKVYGKRDKVNGSVSVPLDEYEKNLKKLIRRLKETQAKLIWASTTIVPEGEAGRFVGDDLKYNKVAEALMNKNKIVINDLHKLSSTFPPAFFSKPGDVHFTKDGYKKLASQVASEITKALE